MACDTRIQLGQTLAQRKKQIEEQVEKLKRALADGSVTVKIGPNGAIAFQGWDGGARNQISDSCAYHKLQMQGSPELRRAQARAEALAGRKADERAIASGTHSHDGGRTWHPGHKK
jgi:hypothetical protein